MFAEQAGLTQVLGRETRIVISSLSMALTSLGSSFEFLTGPIGLTIAGAFALVAVYKKLHGNIEENVAETGNQIKALEGSLKSHQELIKTIGDYKDAVGTLDPTLKALRESTETLTASEQKLLKMQLDVEVRQLTQAIAEQEEKYRSGSQALQEFYDQMVRQHTEDQINQAGRERDRILLEQETVAIDQNKQKLSEARAELASLTTYGVTYEQHLKQSTEAANAHAAAEQKLADEQKKREAALKTLQAAEEQLAAKTRELAAQDLELSGDTLQKKLAQADIWREQQLQQIQKMHTQELQMAEKAGGDIKAVEAGYLAARTQLNQTYEDKKVQAEMQAVGLTKNFMQEAQDFATQSVNTMASQFGNAFAKMVVEGKNFGEAMKALWTNLEETFISMVTQMMVKWALLEAITGGGVSFSSVAGIPGHAIGTDTVVDTPTPFIAGESGPERVTVSPLYGGGGSSSPASATGGGVSIGAVNVAVNVHGVTDPRQIADQVGLEIVKAIKGRGQLNFTGPSIF